MSHSKENMGFYSEERAAHSDQKYVDTSVIIDGRIFDICKTGVLEGMLSYSGNLCWLSCSILRIRRMLCAGPKGAVV